MSSRPGVLSKVKKQVRRGKGGKSTLEFLTISLNDPCVYCGEFGCDTFDHIVPVARREELNTGYGLIHWTNLAPCHARCNEEKGDRGILSVFIQKSKR